MGEPPRSIADHSGALTLNHCQGCQAGVSADTWSVLTHEAGLLLCSSGLTPTPGEESPREGGHTAGSVRLVRSAHLPQPHSQDLSCHRGLVLPSIRKGQRPREKQALHSLGQEGEGGLSSHSDSDIGLQEDDEGPSSSVPRDCCGRLSCPNPRQRRRGLRQFSPGDAGLLCNTK